MAATPEPNDTALAVVGCGQMGSGIALTALDYGHDVTIFDERDEAVRRCEEKWAASASASTTAGGRRRGMLTVAASLADLAVRDVIIEAVREDMATKQAIFAELDRLAPPETILATNTSALSVTEMSRATGRPDRFGGLHFHLPVAAMKTVEVIAGADTSPETVAHLTALGESMGNEVVHAPDTPGFIANRLLVPYLLDAIRVVEAGTASRDAVDTTMRVAFRHPMGPLLLADYIGLDTLRSQAVTMYEGFGEERFRPPAMLEELVAAGHLGYKTGRGFYDYDDPRDDYDHQAGIAQRFAEVLR